MNRHDSPTPDDHSRSLIVESMQSKVKERYATACIFAATLPLILLANLWRSRSESYKRLVITLFFAVYGSIIVLGPGDGFRHQMSVEYYYAYLTLPAFLDELWQVLTFQMTPSGVKDVYKHVTGYLFGGVLDMPRLFFPFIATVYGYFFAGSLLHILRHFNLSRMNYVLLGFVIALIFLRSFEGVFTVRTWTGMWILVYACLKFHEQRKLRYLLLMLVPPFIHHAYFLMAIPAWIVAAFGARPLLYAGLFCASIFTTFLPDDLITDPLAQTERGATQVSAYYREEQHDQMASFESNIQGTNFYNAFRGAGLQRWAPTFLILTLLASGIYIRYMSHYQKLIFSTGLLMLTFSNFVWFISALHNRSMTVATVLILAGFLMARLDPNTGKHFRGLPPYYQFGLHLSLLLFVPWIMFQVSYAMDRLSLFLIAFPFIVWFDPELNMSLKQAINALLGRG